MWKCDLSKAAAVSLFNSDSLALVCGLLVLPVNQIFNAHYKKSTQSVSQQAKNVYSTPLQVPPSHPTSYIAERFSGNLPLSMFICPGWETYCVSKVKSVLGPTTRYRGNRQGWKSKLNFPPQVWCKGPALSTLPILLPWYIPLDNDSMQPSPSNQHTLSIERSLFSAAFVISVPSNNSLHSKSDIQDIDIE